MSTWVNDREAGEHKPDTQLTSCVSAKSDMSINSLWLSVLPLGLWLLSRKRKAGWWSTEMATGSQKVRADGMARAHCLG